MPQDTQPASDSSSDSNDLAPDAELESTASQSSTPAASFGDFHLAAPLMQGVTDLGYASPTEVQAVVFDPVTKGDDVIVQSKTGSGKTTAFCLPLLHAFAPEQPAVQGVVLCPTRELANQVATEATALGKHQGIKVIAIYGGASMNTQIEALESGAHFVVGTPGRVKDLIRRGHLKLRDVRFAVLDEADEMLSMGFWDEVTGILDQMPKARQTLLFSATLPPAIERAAAQYLKTPTRLDLSTDTVNVSTITHVYHPAREDLSRPRNFLYVLESHSPRNAIVFCNRRDETELVTNYLRRFGFRAEALNGDMPQRVRERVLKMVKEGKLDFMVATDVAARGIDINDLDFVFNYDLPDFDEVYVHRAGRTGRIGKKGTAVSLVRGRYITHLASLRRDYGVPFSEAALPTDQEVILMQSNRIAAQLAEEADGVEIDQYKPVAAAMMEREDIGDLMAFLLRSHYAKARRQSQQEEGGEGQREQRSSGDREDRSRRPRRERAPREERDSRRDNRKDEPESTSQNVYVSLGKEDGLDDLTALIERLSEMSGVDIGNFNGSGQVRDHSSHLEVDKEFADQLLAGVHGKPRSAQVDADATMAEDAESGEDEDRGPKTIVCERAKEKRRRRPSHRPSHRD